MLEKIKKIPLSTWLVVITGFYLVGSIMQNLYATKTLVIGTATFTAGSLIAWAVFACMDIVTEIWGKKKAISTFMLSAAFTIFFVLLGGLIDILPGINGEGVSALFGLTSGVAIRIAIASPIAFIIGNYANTLIMHIMRVKSKDEKKTVGFVIRAVLSTLVGQFLDNAIFFILAFAPFIKWGGGLFTPWSQVFSMIFWVTLIEVVLELIISPLTVKVVNFLRHKRDCEGVN